MAKITEPSTYPLKSTHSSGSTRPSTVSPPVPQLISNRLNCLTSRKIHHSPYKTNNKDPYQKRLRLDFKIFSLVNQSLNKSTNKENIENTRGSGKRSVSTNASRFYSTSKIENIFKIRPAAKFQGLESDLKLIREINSEIDSRRFEVEKTYIKFLVENPRSEVEVELPKTNLRGRLRKVHFNL